MSVLVSIQQQCADALAGDPFFAHIPILTEKLNDIASDMEKSLEAATAGGGKSGAFVLAATPTANVNWGNVGGPFFDDIKLLFMVMENVPVNQDPACGTLKAALDIAEEICAILHQFYPTGANGPIIAVTPTIELITNESSNLTYGVHFRTMGGIRTAPPQAATPVIVNNAGTLTLTCATPGAAMFYTLDGSNAIPRNGTLYTAPFTPGAGHLVKVRAWLAGYLGSETATLIT